MVDCTDRNFYGGPARIVALCDESIQAINDGQSALQLETDLVTLVNDSVTYPVDTNHMISVTALDVTGGAITYDAGSGAVSMSLAGTQIVFEASQGQHIQTAHTIVAPAGSTAIIARSFYT